MRDTMFDFSLPCPCCNILISAVLAFCQWTNFPTRVFHLLVNRNANYSFDQKGTYASLPFFRSMISLIGLDPPDRQYLSNIHEDQSCAKCSAQNYEPILVRRSREDEFGSKVIHKINFLFVLSSPLTHIPNIPNKIFDLFNFISS